MPDWPSSLSFTPLVGSYDAQPDDNVLRTQMDSGPGKTRRRFTAVPKGMTFTLPLMTMADFSVFLSFYEVDLEDGALSFTANHPLTGVSGTFRFTAPYRESLKGLGVSVQVDVEQLP